MTGQDRWFFAYISVLAIRLHPRNDNVGGADVVSASDVAYLAADAAFDDFAERFFVDAPLST